MAGHERAGLWLAERGPWIAGGVVIHQYGWKPGVAVTACLIAGAMSMLAHLRRRGEASSWSCWTATRFSAIRNAPATSLVGGHALQRTIDELRDEGLRRYFEDEEADDGWAKLDGRWVRIEHYTDVTASDPFDGGEPLYKEV